MVEGGRGVVESGQGGLDIVLELGQESSLPLAVHLVLHLQVRPPVAEDPRLVPGEVLLQLALLQLGLVLGLLQHLTVQLLLDGSLALLRPDPLAWSHWSL